MAGRLPLTQEEIKNLSNNGSSSIFMLRVSFGTLSTSPNHCGSSGRGPSVNAPKYCCLIGAISIMHMKSTWIMSLRSSIFILCISTFVNIRPKPIWGYGGSPKCPRSRVYDWLFQKKSSVERVNVEESGLYDACYSIRLAFVAWIQDNTFEISSGKL